jgi:hypothetical protein
MSAYLLLLVAAAWHAMGIGTVGLRGRIVASITGVGMVWGFLTPPAGYVGIGGAVATVLALRWSITDNGRAAIVVAVRQLGHAALVVGMALAHAVGAAVRTVFPRRTHEAAPVELSDPVPRHLDTAELALPHGDRWGITTPVAESGETAQVSPLAPVETYRGVITEVAINSRPFNDTAKYVLENFGVSRSKFARDVRALREGKAA